MRGTFNSIDATSALSLLGWWRDAGVDTGISEAPVDWLARANPTPEPRPVDQAPAVALLPGTIEALRAWIAEGDDVPEANWGPIRLAATGDTAAGLMIVADVPDRGDAEAGQLFSGEIGQLFDRMLAAIGRDRASVYLVPLASARPPGGRLDALSAARLAEIAAHHIVLARPKRLLLMGDAPSRALLGMDRRDARGKLRSLNHDGVTIETVATFHPRFLLERPAAKAEAWKDLQLLIGGLDA